MLGHCQSFSNLLNGLKAMKNSMIAIEYIHPLLSTSQPPPDNPLHHPLQTPPKNVRK